MPARSRITINSGMARAGAANSSALSNPRTEKLSFSSGKPRNHPEK